MIVVATTIAYQSLYTSFDFLKFSFRGGKDQREMEICCMPTENKLIQRNSSYGHLKEGDFSAELCLFPVFFPFTAIPVLLFFKFLLPVLFIVPSSISDSY